MGSYVKPIKNATQERWLPLVDINSVVSVLRIVLHENDDSDTIFRLDNELDSKLSWESRYPITLTDRLQ